MNETDVLADSTRALVHHVLQTIAAALYAAATAMFVTMMLILGATGDFPGRWWVAVLGVLAAAVVVHVRSNGLPTAPRTARPLSVES